MKITVSIEKRYAYVIIGLLVLATGFFIVNAFGGSAPSVMGHSWGEVECMSCIQTDNLADYAVTNTKINSVNWSKITSRPAGLEDGDQVGITSESDPNVAEWAKGGLCPCGTCWVAEFVDCDPHCDETCYDYHQLCTPSGWKTTGFETHEGQSCP